MASTTSIGVALGGNGMFPIIPGAKFVQAQASVSATTTDIYTAPTGKRALVYGYTQYAHTGSPTCRFKQKISGTYYYLTPSTALTGPQVSTIVDYMTCLEPGESIGAESASATAFMRCNVIEYDATFPLKAVRLVAPATGDNTFYTCPTGYSAKIMEMPGRTDKGSIYFANESGGTRTYHYNQVINGGSVATTNRTIASSTLTTANTVATIFGGGTLSAGGFINFNVDTNTATQHIWCTVFETPV